MYVIYRRNVAIYAASDLNRFTREIERLSRKGSLANVSWGVVKLPGTPPPPRGEWGS